MAPLAQADDETSAGSARSPHDTDSEQSEDDRPMFAHSCSTPKYQVVSQPKKGPKRNVGLDVSIENAKVDSTGLVDLFTSALWVHQAYPFTRIQLDSQSGPNGSTHLASEDQWEECNLESV